LSGVAHWAKTHGVMPLAKGFLKLHVFHEVPTPPIVPAF
jgi:hypothetical protein